MSSGGRRLLLRGALTSSASATPVVIDPQDTSRQLQTAENLPLGITEQTFKCLENQLDPDHMLALFTDGLSELSGEEGPMLGLGGVSKYLSSAHGASRRKPLTETAGRLTTLLDKMQGNQLAHDDRSFLLVRRSS